jgi:hypothetical protein
MPSLPAEDSASTHSSDGAGLSFPSGEELLSAIRGHHVGDHPLSRLAREFGLLYEQPSPDGTDKCCCRRDELVLAVDAWVTGRLPVPHPRARLHTETLGAVIDRVAQAQVVAWQALMAMDPTGQIVHAAWFRLAELINGYTDLTIDVLHRARRLPALGDRR